MSEVTRPDLSAPTDLLRRPDVLRAMGFREATLRRHLSRGTFTRPLNIGQRMAAWPRSEITAICKAHISGRDDEQVRQLVIELEAARSLAA